MTAKPPSPPDEYSQASSPVKRMPPLSWVPEKSTASSVGCWPRKFMLSVARPVLRDEKMSPTPVGLVE
jgi:hypothetical protein